MSERIDVSELFKEMERQIRDLHQSNDTYIEFLESLSRFRKYSLNNNLLISRQMPHAHYVAGPKTWNKYGRRVRQGEEPIVIIAPCGFKTKEKKEGENKSFSKKKTETTEATVIKIMGFRPIEVFDVRQTDGRPLSISPKLVEGDVQGYDEIFEALEAIADCPLVFEDIKGGSKGYYRMGNERKIAVRLGMPKAHTVKTLLHELAHSRLHRDSSEDRRGGGRSRECGICRFV